MSRILRRPEVRRDLVAIYRFIAQDSPGRGRETLERLARTFQRLADFPGSGRNAGLRQSGVRVFREGHYLVFYQPLPDDDGIELIRIVHGARDWAALFTDDT